MESLITAGDTTKTVTAISSSEQLFRMGIAALVAVVILDVIVSVALFEVFESANRPVSMMAACLTLFAVHLLLIGYLAYRSGFMARIFGILLIVAGLGYLADGFATILVPDFPFSFALFVFGGEVALIFWLLIRATGSASRSFQRTAEDSAELYDRSVSASASSGTVETTEYRLDTPGCKPGGQGAPTWPQHLRLCRVRKPLKRRQKYPRPTLKELSRSSAELIG